MDKHFYYLAVNLICLLFPLLLSFERRIRFIAKYRAIVSGMIGMMALFIPWDIAFTRLGIWGFNDDYIIGLRLFGLPIEEWLFFICIPFACIFTYECVRYFRPKPPSSGASRVVASVIISTCVVLAILFHSHAYTVMTTSLCAGLLIYHSWYRKTSWLGWLLIAWFILLIPFYLSNGILTGLSFWQYPLINTFPDGISEHIVWYNNSHNLGIRIWSVPVDDFFYGLLMVLLTVTGYEAVLGRNHFSGRAKETVTGK